MSRQEECIAKAEAILKEYDKEQLSTVKAASDLRSIFDIKVTSFCKVDSDRDFVEETRKSLHAYTSFTKVAKNEEHVFSLKGVNIKCNTIDIDCRCDYLIQFKLKRLERNASKKHQQDHLYFSSSHETDKFLSLFDLIGTDAFNLIKTRDIKELYVPACTGANLSLENDQTQSYLSLYTIPIGELDMNHAEFTLTSMASKCLNRIQHLLANGFLEQAIIQSRIFFRKFGSHIYMKKVVVGGYILLRTDSLETCNDDSTEKCHAEKIDQILTSMVSTESFGNILDTQGNVAKQLCIRMGGPNINVSLKFWESLFYEYPHLSVAITTGSCQIDDYQGVWELIKQKKMFMNEDEELGKFLERVWSDTQNNNIHVYRQRSSLPSSDVVKCVQYAERSISEIVLKTTTGEVNVLSDLCWEIRNSHIDQKTKWRSELEKRGILDTVLKLAISKSDSSTQCCCRQLIELLQLTEMYLFPVGRKVFLSLMGWIIENQHRVCTQNQGDMDDALLDKTLSMLVQLELTQAKKDRNFCHYLMIEKYLDELNINLEDKNIIAPPKSRWSQMKTFFGHVKESSFKVSNDLTTQARLLSGFENNSHMIKRIKHFVQVTPIGVDPKIRTVLFANVNITKKEFQELVGRGVSETILWKYFEEKDMTFFDRLDRQIQNTERSKVHVHSNVSKILNVLGLTEKYPEKISIQDVQSRINVLYENPENMTDVPWIFLREIIAVNCAFRDSVLAPLHRAKQKNKANANLLSSYMSNNIAKAKSIRTPKSVFPHPCDVLLAVYLCSDMNLQRILANKIASCQLAIPFIHPTFEANSLVAMTWPLREIIIGGKGLSAFSSKLPIVSFVRIGKCDFRSKSKLINEVLRDENEEHATFFHRDCSLGQLQRRISNGVIEVSWFVPSTKSESSWSKLSKKKRAIR